MRRHLMTLAAMSMCLATPAMAQDTEPTRAELEARVAELEKENAELEAKLGMGAEAEDPKDPNSWGKATWGMSEKQVQKLYKKARREKGAEGLFLKTEVAGRDAYVQFSFFEGKLSMVGVIFTGTFVNKNKHIDDWTTLDELLTSKYGTPSPSGPLWDDDLYRDDPGNWGMALTLGRVTWVSYWQVGGTDMVHSLRGENRSIYHVILYQSRATKAAQAAKAKQDRMGDL